MGGSFVSELPLVLLERVNAICSKKPGVDPWQLISQNSADVCHSCSGDRGCQRGETVGTSANEPHLEGAQQRSVSVLEQWMLRLNWLSCSALLPGSVEEQSVKLLSPNNKGLQAETHPGMMREFFSLHYQGEELECFRLGKISYLSSHDFQLCACTLGQIT